MSASEIPGYTRIGIKVTTVIILLLTVFLVRNCARSIFYGTATDSDAISNAYRLGYRAGLAQVYGSGELPPCTLENPLLVKNCQKGFRDGWDAGRIIPPDDQTQSNTPQPAAAVSVPGGNQHLNKL